MSKLVTVTVFPRLNENNCGTSCGVSCNECTACDSNCGFTQREEELMNELYFAFEEVGFRVYGECKIDFVNTSDILYSIEKLNMALVTSGKSTVTHYTYGEYMNDNAPIIALNNKIVFQGHIPSKAELDEVFKKYA